MIMPSTLNYRIGLVQMSCSPDPDANLDKAADRVREAAREGANVVCLPELFRAQYFCQREDIALFDLAEPIPGPSTERLPPPAPGGEGGGGGVPLLSGPAGGG